MREIKFRAWIIKTQKMIDVHEIIFPSYECEMSIGSINVRPYWPPEFKLMQYTGLKDKNGVEIYESDLVSTPAGTGEVKWEDGCYRIYWNSRDNTTLHDCRINHLEVTGNVYETKMG